MRPNILALVLAAGKGGRMGPLTEDRAKPNLPFGGTYHLIDFPLTNCVHSGIHDVWVVQQHHPHGLTDHLANGRPWDLDRTTGGFRTLHPFTDRASENWQQGNAHALYTHLRFIEDFDPDIVVVLSADHIYSYDYRDAIDAHLERKAGLTIVTADVGVERASRHGVVERDGDRVTRFLTKPDEPPTGEVATEIFVYTAERLITELRSIVDDEGEEALGDFGDALVPRFVEAGEAYALPIDGYWRDVGTLDAYWEGHRDLLRPDCDLTLDDEDRPARQPAAGPLPRRRRTDRLAGQRGLRGGRHGRALGARPGHERRRRRPRRRLDPDGERRRGRRCDGHPGDRRRRRHHRRGRHGRRGRRRAHGARRRSRGRRGGHRHAGRRRPG
jgi:glucose-1-phosphate adenylyltransferase